MATAGPAPETLTSAYQGDPARYHRARAFPPGIAPRIVRQLLRALGRPARVLDVGAGTGRLAWPLAQVGVPTVALDLSPGMVAFLAARVRAARPRPPLTVLQGDARHLPLATGSLEAIVTVHMLHLLPDPVAALAEMRRVLQRRGWLAVGLQEHTADAPVGWAQRLWQAALQRAGIPLPRAGWRTYARLEQLVARVGGRVVQRLEAARWQVLVRPAEVWQGVRERRYSPYEGLSPVRHDVFSRRLSREFRRRFGDGQRPRAERRVFAWYIVRFA